MARITVEDCVEKVPNRFELVMLAAQRARDVSAGASLLVERDNDKNPVVALREIADDRVDLDHLRYELIHGLRRHVDTEDQPDEDLDLVMAPPSVESPLGQDDEQQPQPEADPDMGDAMFTDISPEEAQDQ